MSRNYLIKLFTVASPALLLSGVLGMAAEPSPVGYTDTPYLPNQKWRVHDSERPRPRQVTPGPTFSHNAPAPSDATVLFDGTDLSKWTGNNGQAKWKIENGYMEGNKTGSIRTRDQFGDFQLHLEWATPAQVEGSSQDRGNSGVMIYGLYEVQVLDSYDNLTYADGQAGALYGQFPPLANAAKPPGEWQTYDIIFEAPRWEKTSQPAPRKDPHRGDIPPRKVKENRLVKRANVTVIHNGVVLHHKKEYIGKSGHRTVGNYDNVHPPQGPIELQDHNNPIRYRNIWIRALGEYDKP